MCDCFDVPAEKQRLRKLKWEDVRSAHAARFPGARGRIPNFTGAEAAAERLARWPRWQRARVIHCNPDLAQRPVRLAALRAGKLVYQAVPRLAEEQPFIELDPGALEERDLWTASSIRGARAHGRPVDLEEMKRINLIVIGSVGVNSDGSRLGRGGGQSDLEYAVLREAELIHARTPVVTTVHPSQVCSHGRIQMVAHDVPIDAYFAPRYMRTCDRVHRRPRGVIWSELTPERLAAIPCLAVPGAPPPTRPGPRGRRRRRSS